MKSLLKSSSGSMLLDGFVELSELLCNQKCSSFQIAKLLIAVYSFIYFRRNEWIRNCWRSAFVISFNVKFLIFDWTNIVEEWNDSFCKRNAVPYGRSWSLKHRYRLHYSNDFKFWIFLYFNILSRVFETKNHSEASEGLSYIHKFFNLKKFPWIR